MDEKKFYEELIRCIINKKVRSIEEVLKIRREICRKYHIKILPNIIQILLNSDKKDYEKLKFLQAKPVRTISGVAPVAVMTKPKNCPHGKCIQCPGGPNSFFGDVPQSYTGREPATLRGIRANFDPYIQVFNRLEQYTLLNQNFDKVELIIMGGTFLSFEKKYQENFIGYCLKALNDYGKFFFLKGRLNFQKFKKFFELPSNVKDQERVKRLRKKILGLKGKLNFEKEKVRNEKAKVRCVGLTIETRPDFGKLEHGNRMLYLGCTRVELGIQSIYNKVLKKIERGHSVEDSIEAIRILKDLGFKVCGHYMLGLPGTNKKTDIEGLKALVLDERFMVDMLKIYPCMVLEGTKLYSLWKNGNYKAITTEKAMEIIINFKKIVPPWVRILRIQRDIPTKLTAAGVDITNLRQKIHERMEETGIKCNCIRCREPKKSCVDFRNTKIIVRNYRASGGEEFFISAEDTKNDKILGFCRLRFPSQMLRKEITEKTAIVRELHVYSQSVSLNKKPSSFQIQHRGFGRRLLKKAEEIAKENGKNKMLVISGIGVREYYRKFGYKKEGPYMAKRI